MGLFDKVRQVLARAGKVLPGPRRASDDRVFDDRASDDRASGDPTLDDRVFDDRAFDERLEDDRDDVLGTAQPEPDAAAPTPAAAPDDDDAPDPRTAPTGSEVEPPTPRRYRTHTLLPGQSLADVAEQHGVTVEEMAELNGVDPELVFAGQVLRIPHG